VSRQQFVDELKVLGYAPEDRGDGRICFPFSIPVGRHAGRDVMLGFVVGDDFPLNSPGGPHFSPHLLPINTNGGAHPYASVHQSPFGEGWQYWSRPIAHWQQTKKRVLDVVAHVLRLLETL
jgi:hypothetical protein